MTKASQIAWRHAAWFALAVFALFSVLPVWSAWYFSPWEGLGVQTSFWTMLASIPRAAEQVNARELVFTYYRFEAVKLAVLIVVSLGLGRWLAGRYLDAPAAPTHEDEPTEPR